MKRRPAPVPQSTQSQRRTRRVNVARRVEVSREGFRRFEVGDIDGLVALYAADAEVWHPEGWPEPGPTIGETALKNEFSRLRTGWSDPRLIIEEIEGRDDWVVARVRWCARGSDSGAEVEMRYSAATRFEGELIVEVHYTWEHGDALEAAGWSLTDKGQPAGKPQFE
jgi:ketosteroid isomerase-like protein